MKKIYHLTISFFGNLEFYHSNNLTSYQYEFVPSIEHILKYLNEHNDLNKWIDEINNEKINDNEYFNPINHHVFITPYLSLENIKDSINKKTIQSLDVPNLWLDKNSIDEFKHNDINVKNFLSEWESVSKESEIPNIII
jgi:hypothetical protein